MTVPFAFLTDFLIHDNIPPRGMLKVKSPRGGEGSLRDKQKSKVISNSDETEILNRVSRIEGQLKGIKRMVQEKKECLNIITQITAIREAVNMLGVELLKDELICNKEKIDEKYIKTIFKIK